MRNIMKAKVCVPVILILIGLSCVAYATWSWAGATAWCSVLKNELVVHGSVGWGGMEDGGWSTYASITGLPPDPDHGLVQGSGGGVSQLAAIFLKGNPSGSASASISGTGTDGKYYYDGNTDIYPDPNDD